MIKWDEERWVLEFERELGVGIGIHIGILKCAFSVYLVVVMVFVTVNERWYAGCRNCARGGQIRSRGCKRVLRGAREAENVVLLFTDVEIHSGAGVGRECGIREKWDCLRGVAANLVDSAVCCEVCSHCCANAWNSCFDPCLLSFADGNGITSFALSAGSVAVGSAHQGTTWRAPGLVDLFTRFVAFWDGLADTHADAEEGCLDGCGERWELC